MDFWKRFTLGGVFDRCLTCLIWLAVASLRDVVVDRMEL